MAGVSDAKPKPLLKRATFTTKAIGGVTTGLALIGTAADPIKDSANALGPMKESPLVHNAIITLLTIAAICMAASMIASMIKRRRTGA